MANMGPRYLTLDFNPPPAIRRLRHVVLTLGVVALLASGAQLAVAWKAHQEAATELASLEQPHARRSSGTRSDPADAAALRTAAMIARDLQAPWPELMRAMEASQSNDIALLQVEPVVARDSIRITADARNAEAMFDYLTQLGMQGLTEVVLTSHQVRPQEPGSPIRFQAQARWTNLAARAAVVAEQPKEGSMSSTLPGADLAALQRFVESQRSMR